MNTRRLASLPLALIFALAACEGSSGEQGQKGETGAAGAAGASGGGVGAADGPRIDGVVPNQVVSGRQTQVVVSVSGLVLDGTEKVDFGEDTETIAPDCQAINDQQLLCIVDPDPNFIGGLAATMTVTTAGGTASLPNALIVTSAMRSIYPRDAEGNEVSDLAQGGVLQSLLINLLPERAWSANARVSIFDTTGKSIGRGLITNNTGRDMLVSLLASPKATIGDAFIALDDEFSSVLSADPLKIVAPAATFVETTVGTPKLAERFKVGFATNVYHTVATGSGFYVFQVVSRAEADGRLALYPASGLDPDLLAVGVKTVTIPSGVASNEFYLAAYDAEFRGANRSDFDYDLRVDRVDAAATPEVGTVHDATANAQVVAALPAIVAGATANGEVDVYKVDVSENDKLELSVNGPFVAVALTPAPNATDIAAKTVLLPGRDGAGAASAVTGPLTAGSYYLVVRPVADLSKATVVQKAYTLGVRKTP